MVNRLSFGNKRRQDVIDLDQPFRRCADAFSGVLQIAEVFDVGFVSRIVCMVFFALLFLLAAGTDIWRFIQ